FSKDDKEMYDKVKDRGWMDRTVFFKNESKPDTITRNGLTLYFIDEERSFTDAYRKKFIDTYFEQYPKLIKKYNAASNNTITFFIDDKYDGVAATSAGTIRYNPAWFKKNPEDIDVITHELMHVIQNYGDTNAPGWITEGIADYVRATEGINNTRAKWSMPEVTDKHNYNNSYRITARFFSWINQNYSSSFVKQLDETIRQKNYSEATWKQLTGKTVEELWKEYVAAPGLK
ncbi:MAG: basic secretory protein-like protein, partial [Ferruginibacter sp.]